MQRLFLDSTAETHPDKVLLLFWFVLVVLAAVVLSLSLAALDANGLDRLLQDGEPFIPYFTT